MFYTILKTFKMLRYNDIQVKDDDYVLMSLTQFQEG